MERHARSIPLLPTCTILYSLARLVSALSPITTSSPLSSLSQMTTLTLLRASTSSARIRPMACRSRFALPTLPTLVASVATVLRITCSTTLLWVPFSVFHHASRAHRCSRRSDNVDRLTRQIRRCKTQLHHPSRLRFTPLRLRPSFCHRQPRRALSSRARLLPSQQPVRPPVQMLLPARPVRVQHPARLPSVEPSLFHLAHRSLLLPC